MILDTGTGVPGESKTLWGPHRLQPQLVAWLIYGFRELIKFIVFIVPYCFIVQNEQNDVVRIPGSKPFD